MAVTTPRKGQSLHGPIFWMAEDGEVRALGTVNTTASLVLPLVRDSPGRKPGTSTKVMSGMLNASQNLTKRAPFTEELMSKHPTRRKIVHSKLPVIPAPSQWECSPIEHPDQAAEAAQVHLVAVRSTHARRTRKSEAVLAAAAEPAWDS